MSVTFIALGSNLGDRAQNIQQAIASIQALPKTQVLEQSQLYETAPVGGPENQDFFLNGVIQVETELSPQALLQVLQEIELHLGRPKQHEHWGPRTIDLDILAFDDRCSDDATLTLPHPRMHERGFVLEPLAEIAPHWEHPKLKQTAEVLWQDYAENHEHLKT